MADHSDVTPRPRGNPWPTAVAALAVVFLVGLGFSLYWGITRTSGVSDPAYYARGRGYGEQMQAEFAGREWRLEVERRRDELALRVTGPDGRPLPDLRGSLTVLAADGTEGSRHALEPGAVPGEYRTPWPPLPPGGARAVAVLESDGAALRRTLLLNP